MLGFVDYSDPWAEGPNPNKFRNALIDKANSISLFIFLVEALIKIIAMGFFFGENAYLNEGWNKLDLLIVLSG